MQPNWIHEGGFRNVARFGSVELSLYTHVDLQTYMYK